jgi:hypothetical protein
LAEAHSENGCFSVINRTKLLAHIGDNARTKAARASASNTCNGPDPNQSKEETDRWL